MVTSLHLTQTYKFYSNAYGDKPSTYATVKSLFQRITISDSKSL